MLKYINMYLGSIIKHFVVVISPKLSIFLSFYFLTVFIHSMQVKYGDAWQCERREPGLSSLPASAEYIFTDGETVRAVYAKMNYWDNAILGLSIVTDKNQYSINMNKGDINLRRLDGGNRVAYFEGATLYEVQESITGLIVHFDYCTGKTML